MNNSKTLKETIERILDRENVTLYLLMLGVSLPNEGIEIQGTKNFIDELKSYCIGFSLEYYLYMTDNDVQSVYRFYNDIEEVFVKFKQDDNYLVSFEFVA